MRFKEISVSGGITVSDGNYGSHRAGLGITVELDPDDDPNETEASLRRWVQAKMEEFRKEHT